MSLDYTALLRQAPDLYLVLDPDLTIVEVTDAYLEATMTQREQIVGQHIFEAFPANPQEPVPNGSSRLRDSLDRVLATSRPDTMAVQKYDIRRPESDGGGYEVRYWSPINSPVLDPDGKLRLIIHRVKDVTEFVMHEDIDPAVGDGTGHLLARMETMEAEILNRSAQLRESNERLRELSSAKDDFLSRMSHELRTPLTAVIGYSELMKLDLAPDSPMVDDVDAVHRAGMHLANLVDDVLDFSRIESGRLPISVEQVSARDVMREAFEMTKPLAQSSGISLAVANSAEHEFVRADHQRLKQVLVNLISNAVKYNDEGGEVRAEILDPGGEQMRLVVADNGFGIAEDRLPDLFIPFERLGAESSGIQGTGLGLALSQRLVESMGGEIVCETALGEGSTFTVILEKAQPTTEEKKSDGEDPVFAIVSYGDARTVLYVEDTVANVRLVESILRRRPDVQLISAMQGQVGLDLARDHHPDLVLLDLHLPDIGGIEVLKQLRANPETAGLQIAILTADATTSQRKQAVEIGADAFLTKPIVVGDLLRTVDQFLTDRSSANA